MMRSVWETPSKSGKTITMQKAAANYAASGKRIYSNLPLLGDPIDWQGVLERSREAGSSLKIDNRLQR